MTELVGRVSWAFEAHVQMLQRKSKVVGDPHDTDEHSHRTQAESG